MKKTLATIALILLSTPAWAVQETLTTAGPLNCSAVTYCSQNTTDNLFTLEFLPTWPTSGPTPTGFSVGAPSIEIYNAKGGALDVNGLQITLTGSDFYNGVRFLGAIQLETADAAGKWTYRTQWSTYIGSTQGIYVLFNGRNASSPLIRNVYGVRLSGVNGASAFRIGMVNLTAR